MDKRLILNLIRSHVDGNEEGFRAAAYEAARAMEAEGDLELSHWIQGQLACETAFQVTDPEPGPLKLSDFFVAVPEPKTSFYLPDCIKDDVLSVVRDVNRWAWKGPCKFLFFGPEGTGTTAAVQHVARLTQRPLYALDWRRIIGGTAAETSENIRKVFEEIKAAIIYEPLFLFDAVHLLASDEGIAVRTDPGQARQIRADVLRELDALDKRISVFAVAKENVLSDKDFLSRFDVRVNFDRHSESDKEESPKGCWTFV